MKKSGMFEPIKKFFDSEILSHESSLYMRGGNTLSVYQCLGLSEYTETGIMLKTVDGIVKVEGADLELKTFSTGEIAIAGEILTINFTKHKGVNK